MCLAGRHPKDKQDSPHEQTILLHKKCLPVMLDLQPAQGTRTNCTGCDFHFGVSSWFEFCILYECIPICPFQRTCCVQAFKKQRCGHDSNTCPSYVVAAIVGASEPWRLLGTCQHTEKIVCVRSTMHTDGCSNVVKHCLKDLRTCSWDWLWNQHLHNTNCYKLLR